MSYAQHGVVSRNLDRGGTGREKWSWRVTGTGVHNNQPKNSTMPKKSTLYIHKVLSNEEEEVEC
jgi:hypothetical protein